MAGRKEHRSNRSKPAGSQSHRPSPRRLFKQIDLAGIVRLASGAGVTAGGVALANRSPWWLIGAAIYSVLAPPAQDFVWEVGCRVAPAIGDVLADWIRRWPRDPPPD
jgi:hypothetical protein